MAFGVLTPPGGWGWRIFGSFQSSHHPIFFTLGTATVLVDPRTFLQKLQGSGQSSRHEANIKNSHFSKTKTHLLYEPEDNEAFLNLANFPVPDVPSSGEKGGGAEEGAEGSEEGGEEESEDSDGRCSSCSKKEEGCTGLIKDSRADHVSWLDMNMY